MAKRDEIAAAIVAADQRVAALAPRILASPQAPLPEGSWTVRDALSHVTARADGIAAALAFVDRASVADAAEPPPPFDIDEVNRRQIADRRDRGIEDLLNEIAGGHAAALDRLATLDGQTLARGVQLPGLDGVTTVADLLLLAGPRHEQAHLDEIVAAIGTDATDAATPASNSVGPSPNAMP